MDEREEMTVEVMYGSKTKQAYELIKQKILMLEYAPGQPLRELELSEQLSMSRTPIRAAIERLVADCFVDETAGKRTVVSGVSVDSFVELYEVREAMEMLCVSLAAYAWQDHSQIDAARDLVFAANQAGCAFLGRPLVEATGSLRNFRVQAQIGGTDEETAFRAAVSELLERLTAWEGPAPVGRVLALHASQRSTSNTLALWEMVRRSLPPEVQVQEICLRNGTMADCNGCSYTACMHFGEQGGCFYGGPMVEEVYPAVRSCDTLVMVCANYNDALSANLTACVNRLTALFRQTRFYDKRLYGLVVSGYSGGDLLARQLISALNMNKAFYLPPRFCLLETANERGSLVRLPGIREKARCFARQMME